MICLSILRAFNLPSGISFNKHEQVLEKNSYLKTFESVFLQASETILVLPQALIRISLTGAQQTGVWQETPVVEWRKLMLFFLGK